MLIFQNANAASKVIDNASQVTDVAWESINNLVTAIIAQLPYILAGLLVLLVFYVTARIGKVIFWNATRKTRLDERLRILFGRLIFVVMVVLGVFTAFTVIVPSFSFGNLIAGLGLTSVVIGFATKDIISNLLSGVMILWHRPFRIGDYIFVGNNQGKVEYIGVRATSLRKDDGELVLIPNGDMYSSSLTIRGAGSTRRMNLKLNIAFDADIDKAKKLILDALSSGTGVVKVPPPNAFVTDLAAEGVIITVNFWIDTNESKPREVFDHAAIGILKSLDKAGVELFPPGSANVTVSKDEA